MSLFSWLTGSKKKKAKKSGASVPRDPVSSGLSRMEPTRPVTPQRAGAKDAHAAANGQAANRKSERMARRELLYTVVRESMVRAGVLSASYKFKVLSLDARGRQFLIMIDVARGHAGEPAAQAEIEAMIAQAAKSRYDILVTAVYWRMNEHVAVGLPVQRTPVRPSQPMPLESQPGALHSIPPVSQPAPLRPAVATFAQSPEELAQDATMPLRPAARNGGRYEPLEDDEVAAFKRALTAGISGSAATLAAQKAKARTFNGASTQGPQSYTLLTGFEDTEMPDAEVRQQPALSATQYGELN
jgi:hypothetical protein